MATTPPPQNNSTDPQVPGNFPGTFQNPTQLPAPVNPAADPEVPPLPNDVDPNFIPNPAPVDNTIDPEVPQPEQNFPRKKRFDAEPVSPAANPEVPQPTVEQNLFVDAPATVSSAANPQIPPPQDFGQDARTSDFPPAQDFGVDPQVPSAQDFGQDARTSDFPPAQDFGVDPQVPSAQDFGSDPRIIVPDAQDFGVDPQVPATPIVQNYFTDETPVVPAGDTGFDDFYGEQTYTVNYTGTADAVPGGNTGFDDFYGEQTYTANFTGTADARPVFPAANPQVPNIFSSIGSLLSSLFGIRPTPVLPAANPQVAQAFPVPAPTVFTPTPIAPVSNPQVTQPPIVQNFFTDRTPTPVVPAANPQVPLAQDFGSEPPIVIPPAQDFGTDPQVPEPPIIQNYFVDEPPIVQNYFTDAAPAPIVQNYFTDATPVSPAANPQVPLVQDFGFSPPIEVPAAQDFGSDPQLPEPFYSTFNDIPARFKQSDPVNPAANPEVPQPTQDFGGRKKADPDIVDDTNQPQVQEQNSSVVTSVSQSTLAQQDPAIYKAYQTDLKLNEDFLTQKKTAEAAAVYGGEQNLTIDQLNGIRAEASIEATATVNNLYKNEIEAAGAGTVVPAATPLPTPTPTVVANDPQVVVPPTRVVAVSTETLLQNDPETAQEYTAFKAETAEQLTTQRIAEAEAANGGPISVSAQVMIAARAERDATADANFRYQDQIEAAGAATVVPADTPPPTSTPAVVVNNPQVVVPPTKIAAVSTETLLQNDPETAQEYTAFKNETAAQLTEQRIAEAEAANGGPISVSAQVMIAARAERDATTDANIRYQDQIEAAGAATVVPADTPPPTVVAPTVDSATNQQVPPAQTGEALIDPDNGEVLGYVDAATGEVTDAPSAVSAAADPQVPSTANTTIASVSQSQLAQTDSALYNDYNSAVVTNTAATEEQLTAQALATYGVTTPSDLPLDVQLDIREQALTLGVTEANTLFKDQLEASGAATTEPAGTPPPTVVPAPPSPSPYEIFLAQEAAATTAAEAEAQARFDAQFDDNGDIIGSSDDPQAFPVTDPGDGILVTEIEPVGEEFSGYEDFYGTEEFNNVGEFQAEPVADDNSGYEDFYGTEEFNNVGEFQAEPVGDEFSGYDDFYGFEDDVGEFQAEPELVADDNSGYADFFGTDADFDVGEFQAEPELVADAQDYGVDDADPLGDFIGDLQSEPSDGDGESAGFGDFFGDVAAGTGSFFKSFAGAVSGAVDPQANSSQQSALDSISGLIKSAIKTPNQLAAERQAAAKAQAKAQAQVNAQRKQANDGDWRVRLRLAGGADYLYKAKGANGKSAAGILEPLAVTDGVIFPYTPQITTQYQAKYNPYELTHSNYKGYFYQGSSVNEISITATFTAQDTSEANYLLAVIHFFRSVTKMFYGQDDASKRGSPPPLVFLQGLGEYQFNLHPCVVSSFDYTLPNDVDYIRANSVNFNGTNLLQRRDLQNLPIDYVNSVSSRLSNAGLTKGGLNTPPPPPTLGTNSPTYVPTKMEIRLVLLPMQTRSQVSQQFSLKQFASGDLIRGGFW